MPRPAFEFRGKSGGKENGRSRRRPEFTFRARPPPTSSRPLLSAAREPTPEFAGGAEVDGEQERKFASLDDITDSEEGEMDVSLTEDEDEDQGSQPPRKKQATESATNGIPEAKWSNPDPYTVLPPADESQGKPKDFVKMIRKARVSSGQSKPETEGKNAVVSNDDFISFGDLGLDQPPEDAPREPRSLRERDGDPALGSRKRTRDDRIIGPPRKPDTRFNLDASIIDTWRPLPGRDTTPWIDRYSASTLHSASRLHNEVLTFYHWVRPRPFENIVRDDLISRLQALFQNRFQGCQLHAFGSFASGVYLPVADMDLVLLSRQFIRSGKKTVCQRPRDIYALAGYIKNADIAVPGSVLPIAHARVPILKFDDRLTGLRVDLSFDNSSGIAANNTFQSWKTQFPAMPVIVSVIKQFLLLRGLNEVPTGGLGGFSIICLVTSLLQHLPPGAADPNLGAVLMDFFDFYGNQFDMSVVGIQLEPPGFFNKASRDIYEADQKVRLAITDPNNPDNDISGGSKEMPRIFSSFAEAHRSLKQAVVTTAFDGSKDAKSLLGSIIGANYDSYESQRQQLHDVFKSDPRFARYWTPSPPPPPPPPPPEDTAPPPPPPLKNGADAGVSVTQQGNHSVDTSKFSRKQLNSFERANRLRSLRPDMKHVPKLVSVDQAVKLGGYPNLSQMDRDLNAREKAREEQVADPTAAFG